MKLAYISSKQLLIAKLKKEFEAEKARVLRDEKNVRPNVTFGEWYQEWFEKCKSPQLKSDVSRKTYDRKVRNTYCKILGEKRMENISQMNMQAATTELIEKGYTDRSVRELIQSNPVLWRNRSLFEELEEEAGRV